MREVEESNNTDPDPLIIPGESLINVDDLVNTRPRTECPEEVRDRVEYVFCEVLLPHFYTTSCQDLASSIYKVGKFLEDRDRVADGNKS